MAGRNHPLAGEHSRRHTSPKAPRMYKTTLALLVIVVAVTAYFLRVVPYSVVVGAAACALVETAIQLLWFRRAPRIPYTAMITGIIIGCVAPSNAPVLLVLLASIVAMLSKSFIRLKGSNVFNPAVAGLLVSLLAFGVGDNWWIAGPWQALGVLASVTPLFVICSYEGRRLTSGLSFFAVSLIAYAAMGGTAILSSGSALWTAIISVNYLLAFVMVSEPRTSPNRIGAQIAYGAGLAILATAMAYYRIEYAMLLALAIGNVAYAAYRVGTGSR